MAEGARRGRGCAAWQRVRGVAEGVRRGRGCAAWQWVRGVAEGARRGRGCAAWQGVCGKVIENGLLGYAHEMIYKRLETIIGMKYLGF